MCLTPSTLHSHITVPRFISQQVETSLNDPNEDYNGDTYRTQFIPISTAKTTKFPKTITLEKDKSGKVKSKAAALVDLVSQTRSAGLWDEVKGLKKGRIIDPLTRSLIAVVDVEVDHFHPANGPDGFITRLEKIDHRLQKGSLSAQRFVERLQNEYEDVDDPDYWSWKDMINESDNGTYSIKNSYKVRIYNFIDNLWLVKHDDNKSWGDRHKIPLTGCTWKDSPLAEHSIYGQGFLKLFGTVNNKGQFTRTSINSDGVIDMASFNFDPTTGKVIHHELTGLGKIARNWFLFQYTKVSSPAKELQTKTATLTQLTEQLTNPDLDSETKETLKNNIRQLMGHMLIAVNNI